jgi:hypothetical protein
MSKDKDRELLRKITEAANEIARKQRQPHGNHIIVSAENADILQDWMDGEEKREKLDKRKKTIKKILKNGKGNK